MYKRYPMVIIMLSLALSFGALGNVAVASTVAQEVIDARQEAQIWTTFALNPYLRANDLKVSVQNGKATLSGIVEENVNKELAKEIALGVSGITDVDNQIVVQADFIPKKSTSVRSYGEMIDDATITAAVKSKLMWSKFMDGLSVNVETKFGKVTLLGTAYSTAAKDNAGSLARNTRGVVSVDNQLVVDGTKANVVDSAKNSADKAGRDISDSWITAKVKYTFLYSANVAGSDIAVSTNSGIVTLRGLVGSGAERELAVELAQNVRGVTSVDAKDLKF